jgi:polar amino acid transport system substrate-binding protein
MTFAALIKIMKKVILASLFCLALIPNALAEKVVFTFAYDVQEGFPSFIGNGSEVPEEYPGTYIEMLRLVAQRVPIELQLVRYPWQRCKAYLRDNKVDGINSSYRASRTEIGVFPLNPEGAPDRSRRITSDSYLLYASKGAGVYFDPDTDQIMNAEQGILAPLGYSILEDFRKRGLKIEAVPSGVAGLLNMLALGRASGIIAHQSQADHILAINADTMKNIIATKPVLAEKDYYILISKHFYQNHPKIAEQIWNTIGDLRQTHLPKILDRYYRADLH